MTPERVARLVARWVRLYTRDLPAPLAQRRIEEIDADLHDHIALERAQGTSDRRIALSILSRMVRGLPADASWHGRHAAGTAAYRSIVRIALAVAFVLLLPLLAMQFTDVSWGVFDFVFAGVIVVGLGLMYELATRKTANLAYRAAFTVAIGTALMLLWTMGAVGIIGEDGDPADLMYFGVLAVGIVGAVAARFRPPGMARALVAMALAVALVAAIALIAGKHEAPISSVWEILGLNGFFAGLFLGSAWLFRRAARRQPHA